MVGASTFVRTGVAAIMAMLVGVSSIGAFVDSAQAADKDNKTSKTSKTSKTKKTKTVKVKLVAAQFNGQFFLCFYPNKKGLKPSLHVIAQNSKKLDGSNSKYKSPVAIPGAVLTDPGGWSCP